MDHWNWYTKHGPYCNFQPNDNQTFILYMKSTLVLYRKGLCGVSGSENRLGKFLEIIDQDNGQRIENINFILDIGMVKLKN